MEERGATREEVLRTIAVGRMSEAKFGRRIHAMTFSCDDHLRSRLYEHKLVEAYSVEEEGDIIVITVVVKYF
jgi:hypothetical protein